MQIKLNDMNKMRGLIHVRVVVVWFMR
jgi:hypothetical protein